MTQSDPSLAGAPGAVSVAMHYLVDTGETPVFHQSASPSQKMQAQGTREPCMVTIRDARPMADALSLDVEGFVLARQPSAVTDFLDDAQLKTVYEPELAALIARLTGASEVVVYDHTRRSSEGSHRERHNSRDPVPLPHSDYTEPSALQRLRDVFGDEEGAVRARRPFAIVNAWRSMAGTIEQWPLAVCDARSVDESAMHTIVRLAPHRDEPSFEYARSSETRHASRDEGHRWFWFPQMTRDEVLLFKNWDTRTDGRARYALHSAFEDPSAPPDAAPRESIESRAFLFFD